MLKVHTLTFGPFQLNTSVLSDETGECVIVDPGCFTDEENKKLTQFLEKNNLKPVRLLQTHCHLDHVFGAKYVADTYQLEMEAHIEEHFIHRRFEDSCNMYNLPGKNPPPITKYINEGDKITFGNSELEVLFVPGHTPGHIVFISKEAKSVIAGDVLFHRSIGRTDLPGGNHAQLIKHIKEKVFLLPDDYTVFPGHGGTTTIGYEKENNPFVRG